MRLMGAGFLPGYAGAMLGYVLATFVGLLLIALFIGAMGGPRVRAGRGKRTEPPAQPSADEPTPDWSATATPREMDAARKHTPPA
jgi:hypothetical protein